MAVTSDPNLPAGKFKFQCNACGVHLLAREDKARSRMRCPQCNAVTVVPDPADSVAVGPGVSTTGPVKVVSPSAPPKSPPPARGASAITVPDEDLNELASTRTRRRQAPDRGIEDPTASEEPTRWRRRPRAGKSQKTDLRRSLVTGPDGRSIRLVASDGTPWAPEDPGTSGMQQAWDGPPVPVSGHAFPVSPTLRRRLLRAWGPNAAWWTPLIILGGLLGSRLFPALPLVAGLAGMGAVTAIPLLRVGWLALRTRRLTVTVGTISAAFGILEWCAGSLRWDAAGIVHVTPEGDPASGDGVTGKDPAVRQRLLVGSNRRMQFADVGARVWLATGGRKNARARVLPLDVVADLTGAAGLSPDSQVACPKCQGTGKGTWLGRLAGLLGGVWLILLGLNCAAALLLTLRWLDLTPLMGLWGALSLILTGAGLREWWGLRACDACAGGARIGHLSAWTRTGRILAWSVTAWLAVVPFGHLMRAEHVRVAGVDRVREFVASADL